jgi:hypothetical protein
VRRKRRRQRRRGADADADADADGDCAKNQCMDFDGWSANDGSCSPQERRISECFAADPCVEAIPACVASIERQCDDCLVALAACGCGPCGETCAAPVGAACQECLVLAGCDEDFCRCAGPQMPDIGECQ